MPLSYEPGSIVQNRPPTRDALHPTQVTTHQPHCLFKKFQNKRLTSAPINEGLKIKIVKRSSKSKY
jgi:hypothetical protein